MRLAETARIGDRMAQLEALRDKLAAAIDGCESMRDLASLARQYRETIADIEQARGIDDENDEIAAIILRSRKPTTNVDGTTEVHD